MKVIALTGYDRAGKDTIVEYIEEFLDDKVGFASFSLELKKIHMDRLGIDSLDEYNELLHSNTLYKGVNLRDSIYLLSEELKLKDPNCIIDKVIEKIETLKDKDLVVITDTRFKSEYDYIKKNKYPLIKVVRDKIPLDVRNKPWNKDILNFERDYTIYNNRTLDDLYHEVEHMLEYYKLI